MARKVLARKITRKQALSYTRTVPNPLGVTAIASVNGRRAYERQYAATRALLGSPEGAEMRRRVRRNKKALSAAQKKALAKGRATLAKKRGKKSVAKKASAPKRRKAASKAKAAPRPKKAVRRSSAKKSTKFYGGKYRALRARVGGRSVPTYVYLTKKKRVRKIPDFALAGYRSRADLKKRTKSAKGKAASWKRFNRLFDRRKKAADRVAKRILAGKYAFTPNRIGRRRPTRTVTFKEWEKSMIANARRKKKARKSRKGRKKATKKQLRALAKARAALRRKHSKKRKAKKARRNPLMQAAANKRRKKARRSRRKARRNPLMQAAANKRRGKSRRRARRNPLMQAAANKRRRKARRNSKHGYRRNMAAFVSDLKTTLKVGGVVAAGLILQKSLTKILTGTGYLDKLGAFKSIVAGGLVALAGGALVTKFVPGQAKLIASGMGAGLVHTILIEALGYFNQPQAVAYLGDYTEARGNAMYSGTGQMGSYYEFQPGQVYSGMGQLGEYYQTPGVSGFGGYGDSFGQAPLLTQAAAGVGEYYVTGGQGIGEYEEVTPEYSPRTSTRDGIRPDLTSAERAMNVAEAAAGVGNYGGLGADVDVPLQSTVYPQGQAEDIPDQPGGSRAGVFCGSNGVFGPCG